MEGVELLSFQALWFVVAGFILGFAASTLWEWLYYRGKRRAQQERMPPVGASLPRADDRPTSPDEAVEEKPAAPWTVPYRSPKVYLESEQLSPVQPTTATSRISPVTASTLPTPEQPSLTIVPDDSKAPRLNPTTLATLQATVADTPIAQTPARHIVGAQPFAEQGGANTKVYDTPLIASSADVGSAPAAATLSAPPSEDSATERAGVHGVASAVPTATLQSPVQLLRSAALDPANSHDHPDDLAMIKGVGEAYKRRLYSAGVYTWRQVAESDTETLRRITRAKPNATISAWRQQAQELAEKYQRWHTTFQGPLDDLTRIDGIGAITADLLYKAGICTYDQLAGALPDELAKIVPAPTVGDEIDFDGWINAAVRLASAKRRNQGLLS